MPASGRSVVRRTGRILTGVGALVVLCALLAGAPVALLAFAGNPLPDHLPTITEVGTALTSRDDGQLFLRALALAGWFGWATFAFSVLVELGAQTLRRPAPKLPGMTRQQKAAAALVGSVALILAASPAAASAAAVYAGPSYGPPGAPAVATLAAPGSTAAMGTAHGIAAPRVAGSETSGLAALSRGGAIPDLAAPLARTGPPDRAGAGLLGLVAPDGPNASDEAAPMYRVARGDYLGEVAERYLDEFTDYRRLAELNRLDDPDRIRPGQLIRLPAEATDQGARSHATGRLVSRPAAPKPPAPRPAPERTAPERVAPAPPSGTEATGQPPTMTVGAARASTTDGVNRPLAVSAVLAVASIVGAQIGAVLGLRRRPATAGAAPRLAASTRTGRSRTGRSGTGRTSGATTRGGSTTRVSGSTTRTSAGAGGTSGARTGGTAAGRTSGRLTDDGSSWAPGETAPSGGATAEPSGGATAEPSGAPGWAGNETAPTGVSGWADGKTTTTGAPGWADDETTPTGAPGWAGDEGWSGDDERGGPLAGGPGLGGVADGPQVGRHRRT
ncbi:hypothetical protein DKT68_23020 [Micromonospora acroterricola]|uniref:LysM domain-containing protein n=1 Tax=Micromonospora acroterricola TaxID=2202421 RepID=A0A317CVW3_9ACTN|nr:hypothetical protein DKT68_23020 [Micromonospora acroterricola]